MKFAPMALCMVEPPNVHDSPICHSQAHYSRAQIFKFKRTNLLTDWWKKSLSKILAADKIPATVTDNSYTSAGLIAIGKFALPAWCLKAQKLKCSSMEAFGNTKYRDKSSVHVTAKLGRYRVSSVFEVTTKPATKIVFKTVSIDRETAAYLIKTGRPKHKADV